MAKKKNPILVLRRSLMIDGKAREAGFVLGEFDPAKGVSRDDLVNALNIDGVAVADAPADKAAEKEGD